jgi:hypothetical protein
LTRHEPAPGRARASWVRHPWWPATATGAHAIATDPSNRFAFVPRIARLNDNVLEPPKENPGPHMILQFGFDAQTERLTANSLFRVEPPATFAFIPPWISSIFPTSKAAASRPIVWTTRPASCPRCRRSRPCPTATPHGAPALRYTSRLRGNSSTWANRGHNSIAGSAVDAATGHLLSIGMLATNAVPSAFSLDPAALCKPIVSPPNGRCEWCHSAWLQPSNAHPLGVSCYTQPGVRLSQAARPTPSAR